MKDLYGGRDFEWFDKKYRDGQKHSLEDEAYLISGVGFKLKEREEENIIKITRELLFGFDRNGGYSNAICFLLDSLIYTVLPFANINEEVQEKFRRWYGRALERHRETIEYGDNSLEE